MFDLSSYVDLWGFFNSIALWIKSMCFTFYGIVSTEVIDLPGLISVSIADILVVGFPILLTAFLVKKFVPLT